MTVLALTTGCVEVQPASDTGNTLSPTALSLPGPDQPLAYEPEMRQVFAADSVYEDMPRRWVEVYKAQRTR